GRRPRRHQYDFVGQFEPDGSDSPKPETASSPRSGFDGADAAGGESGERRIRCTDDDGRQQIRAEKPCGGPGEAGESHRCAVEHLKTQNSKLKTGFALAVEKARRGERDEPVGRRRWRGER